MTLDDAKAAQNKVNTQIKKLIELRSKLDTIVNVLTNVPSVTQDQLADIDASIAQDCNDIVGVK
jgi:hypothetical protein